MSNMSKDENKNASESGAPSFGRWLREERMRKNVSLEEIAAVTKVHITQLKHLEDDERDKLPAPAFVRGFLISYARHLGLEEDHVLARFKEGQPNISVAAEPIAKAIRAAQSPQQPKVRLVESSPLGHAPATKDLERPTPKMLKPKNVAMIVVGLVVVIGLGMLIALGKKSKREKTPKKEVAAQVEGVSSATTSTSAATGPADAAPAKNHAQPTAGTGPTLAPPEAAPNAPKKYTLELRATEQSWVNVRIDDKDSSGVSLVPGSNYSFEADRKILLSLSDAGSVEIRWNGTWYAPLGFRGDVRSLTLPEQLAKLTLKSAATAAAKKPVAKKKPATAPGDTVPAPAAESAAPAAPPAPAAAEAPTTPPAE